jgi:hypothetical protein
VGDRELVIAAEQDWRLGGRILATNDDGLITQVRLESEYKGCPTTGVTVADASGMTAWSNRL